MSARERAPPQAAGSARRSLRQRVLLPPLPPPRPDLSLSHSQVSQSKEHQQFITFLQRLLGPLLEAYSSAAIFIHNFSGPVPEPEYLQKLHKYLLTRTERNIAVYGTRVTSLASFESYDFLDYWDLSIIENWGGGITKLF